MARLGTRTLTGKSGQDYTFNVYPGDMRFNDFIPGVYYVYSEGGDGEGAVFLGESGNVDVTLQKQDKSDWESKGFNRIAFHMNAKQSVRDGIVDDLMPVLAPACN